MVPIISEVGHETDPTSADLVADYRAATPSAAAEIAVCEIAQVENQIHLYEENLTMYIKNIINNFLYILIEDFSIMN